MSIVIIGAGPNLGMAVARRFGREGLAVGLVSRTQSKLDGLAAELEGEGITAAGAAADIRDPDALAAAIASLAGRLGDVEVLEYSPLPASEFMRPILETTVDDVRGPLEFSVLGAVAATRAVLDPMRAAGRGTILFTTGGAAVHPNPLRAGVGISFAGEVAYARMLHDELAERGDPCRAHRDRRADRAGPGPRAGGGRGRPLVAPRGARRVPDADRVRGLAPRPGRDRALAPLAVDDHVGALVEERDPVGDLRRLAQRLRVVPGEVGRRSPSRGTTPDPCTRTRCASSLGASRSVRTSSRGR